MSKLGQIAINVLLLLGFSGPEMNCVGYEPDPDVPCTTNIYVTKRVDPDLYQSNPYGWCYETCHQATFDWDLSIPLVFVFILSDSLLSLFVLTQHVHVHTNHCSEFALSICFVIAASIPLYLRLKEDKVAAEPRGEFLRKFWSQIQRRACWQIVLCKFCHYIFYELPFMTPKVM